jgi:predicted DNA-binding transcriptional regulator AlpA
MAKKAKQKRVKVRPVVLAHAPARPATAPPTLPEIGFVRLPGVLAHVGLGKSTLWSMIREQKFPAPIRLSARNVGWNVADVRSWIASRVAAAQQRAA